MMALLFAVQMLLPLALALWILLAPPIDRVTRFALVAGLGLLISALLLTGVWTVMPWWWPWLCAAIGLAGAARALPKSAPFAPRGRGWVASIAVVAVAALGGWFTAQGIAGRAMPEPVIELAFPLPPGRYIIANGGANLALSSHAETLDQRVPRHRLWRGQSYGVDIVALNRTGRTTSGLMPGNPHRYAIYGRAVLAPCAGLVIAAVDGLPDSPIPLRSDVPSAGNHVILRCGAADVLLAHFRPRSVVVRRGQRVAIGQPVGAVGNSGSSSEPHLHLHAQQPGTAAAPFAGAPLTIQLDGRTALRNARF